MTNFLLWVSEIKISDVIPILALLLSVISLGFSFHIYRSNRQAKLRLEMTIGRSYQVSTSTDASGNTSRRVIAENPPTTKLLIRNMGARPSALLNIDA